MGFFSIENNKNVILNYRKSLIVSNSGVASSCNLSRVDKVRLGFYLRTFLFTWKHINVFVYFQYCQYFKVWKYLISKCNYGLMYDLNWKYRKRYIFYSLSLTSLVVSILPWLGQIATIIHFCRKDAFPEFPILCNMCTYPTNGMTWGWFGIHKRFRNCLHFTVTKIVKHPKLLN